MKGRVLLSASKKAYIAVKLGTESSLETVRTALELMQQARLRFEKSSEN